MNEIEVAKLPNGIEGFLSQFKPASKVIWNSNACAYEIDKSTLTLDEIKFGFEEFKNSVREVYSFGETIARGTPKFCLALRRIFDRLSYVEDPDREGYSYHKNLNVKPTMVEYSRGNENFRKIVGFLGVSETAAYRYKDLAVFVDEKTCELYKEFQGYSLSLLAEMYACLKSSVASYRLLAVLKESTKRIPVNTTIDDIRLYRKAVDALNLWGGGPFKDYTYKQREELKQKSLKYVLKVYNELVQKQEVSKLDKVLTTSNTPEKKNVVTLVDSPEIQTLRKELAELRPKAERAALIGNCANCKYKDINLNKCRCCRRYENLKDLFESK